MEKVPLHFLLLGAGEVLKASDYVTAQKLQEYINSDTSFAIRPPISECEQALELLKGSGFLTKLNSSQYLRAG